MKSIKRSPAFVRLKSVDFMAIQHEVTAHYQQVSSFHKEHGLVPLGSEGVPLYFRVDTNGQIGYRRVATSPSPAGQDGIVSDEGVTWFVR